MQNIGTALIGAILGLSGVLMLGSLTTTSAQLQFTGCVNKKGKVKFLTAGDSPSKPCPRNQTEIMLSGSDKTDALMITDDALMDDVSSLQAKDGDLTAKDDELMNADADLQGQLDVLDERVSELEANAQIFPGDGFPNPDVLGVSGHGPELSYTDNGDLTATDNLTKFHWEQKLATDGSDGGNCDDLTQANRSVHCVNNIYTWTDGVGNNEDADGTLWTEFLYTLNNTCAADALLAPGAATDCSANGDDDCAVANGGPGGSCGFAGHRDWEIPNVKKLQSIVDYSRVSPTIDPSFPGATAELFYWSATTNALNSVIAWIVSFNFGGVLTDANKDGFFRARTVRTGSD